MPSSISLGLSPIFFEAPDEKEPADSDTTMNTDTQMSFGFSKGDGNQTQRSAGRWSSHRELFAAAESAERDERRVQSGQASTMRGLDDNSEGVKRLLQGWLAAQAAFVSFQTAGQWEGSVPVTAETIVHLRVTSLLEREKRECQGFSQSPGIAAVFVDTSRTDWRGPKDLFFLLRFLSVPKLESSLTIEDVNGNNRRGGSIGYVLLESQMLTGRTIHQQEEVHRSLSVFRGSLTLKAGSCQTLPCFTGVDYWVKDGPPFGFLRWLEKAASEALTRKILSGRTD